MTKRFLLTSMLIGLAGALVLMLSTPIRAAPAPCLAKNTWFPHSMTPRPNDGGNFVINCDFHQWAWQMFLWLTQVTGPNGELRFEAMPNTAEVKGASRQGLPLFDLVYFRSIQAFLFEEKKLFPPAFGAILSQYLERLGIAPGMTRKIVRACIVRDWLRRHEEGDRARAAFLLRTLAGPLGDLV